jgi:uncharacterized protein
VRLFEHTDIGAVSDSYLRDLAGWLRRYMNEDGPDDSLPLLPETLSSRAISPLNTAGTAQYLGYTADVFRRRFGLSMKSTSRSGQTS